MKGKENSYPNKHSLLNTKSLPSNSKLHLIPQGKELVLNESSTQLSSFATKLNKRFRPSPPPQKAIIVIQRFYRNRLAFRSFYLRQLNNELSLSTKVQRLRNDLLRKRITAMQGQYQSQQVLHRSICNERPEQNQLESWRRPLIDVTLRFQKKVDEIGLKSQLQETINLQLKCSQLQERKKQLLKEANQREDSWFLSQLKRKSKELLRLTTERQKLQRLDKERSLRSQKSQLSLRVL